MALPALKLETEEEVVEERLARLEANVEHLQSDVTDIKTDVRRLNEKIDRTDEKLCAKIDGADAKLTARSDSLMDTLNKFQLSVERQFAKDRVWWLLMCGALLGVMAKGFKWL